MSTNKLLQSLSEDPQLEKQIGCMAGILQLFDRHQVLTGRRLYGHKRISAAAPRPQASPSSNCGSPASETSVTSSESTVRHPSDNYLKQKHATAAGITASPEQQKSQAIPTPSTPTDIKCTSAYPRTPPLPLNDASPHGSSGDQLPKVSFDMARSSILTPRRLDSSRSLHEGRVNASHEGKVFARRSVDTAERAAAAARGALKELSKISTDFTGPSRNADQVSIRDIVRSSFSKEQQVPKSTANPLLSGSSDTTHTAFAPRMSSEGSIYASKSGVGKDVSRAVHFEAKSSAECNLAEKAMQSSNAFVSQANGHAEASRPPRHYKPKSETPAQSRADISESLRLLAKLREATPAYSSLLNGNAIADNVGNKVQISANHAPRPATSSLHGAKEGPVAFASRAPLPRASDRTPSRMNSCEPSRSSSVDVLLQGGSKAREIPRLSLDGRGSGAGFKADREAGTQGKLQYPRSLLNSRSVSCSNSDCDTESLHEKRTSFSSNVVAKLMGLDEMPNGETAEAAQPQIKANPYGPLDQRASRMLNTAVQDTNPTFSQCGKYVSASFFPSKRRDDIKIAMDSEEEEEDSYLKMGTLGDQEARTLSVRVGSSNLQAGHRLATTESANNLGHPCFQPKNHHLIEDRPPHVLSPAARLCAQIEEMQRSDSLYKGVDRGFRTMEMQQSSQQDLEALKHLLEAIHLNKEYSNGAGSHLEKLDVRGTSGKQRPDSARMLYPHEQYAQQQARPSAVIWKTKRMLNDELYTHAHYQDPNSRRMPVEYCNRKVKHTIQNPDSLPLYRQRASEQMYNQANHTRADMRSSPAASHSSTYSTPKRTNISNDCITPIGTANANTVNMGRRLASRTNSPPNFMSPRFLPSPQSPFSQQLRQSYTSSCSWEGSSVSSTSSGPSRDQHLLGNSSYSTADKRNKQVERLARKKVSCRIIKDKEECKANLASLKPSPDTPVEKQSKSGVGSRLNARTARRRIPPQKPDHVRSSMQSPTKSSARKAEEVKRKLNFATCSPGRIRPMEMQSKDEDTEFVDKNIVSSIDDHDSTKYCAHEFQSNEDVSKTGHYAEPFSALDSQENQLTNTPSNITRMKTEVEVKSPLLLLPCADGETNLNDQQVTASIHNRNIREHITEDEGSPTTPIHSPAGALKLPQVPQQENEDTESQGDKSTGSCGQPSPVSVLAGPFYEEDVPSPPTSTKFHIKLEEMEVEVTGKVVKGEYEISKGSPQISEWGFTCHDRAGEDCSTADFDYVKQLLGMMSILIDTDDEHCRTHMLKLRPLEHHLFLQLEEENLNNASDCKTELGSMWQRRLLFDNVSVSLERRLRRWHLCQRQPWLLACEPDLRGIMAEDCSPALEQGMIGLDEEKNVCLSREGGRVLLEEVWEEIGMHRKQRRQRVCKQQSVGTGACEEEEAEDGTCDEVGRALEEDLFGGPFHTRRPDSWASLLMEKGELGLDLERLIFKDLIDHTIRDLGLLTLPTITKRQLFKPHN